MPDENINSQILKSPLTGSEELPLNDSGKDRKTTTTDQANLSIKKSLERPLLSSPDEPDDNDRVLFGQGSSSYNIIWSRFKELIQGVLSIFDSILFNTSYDPTSTVEAEVWWDNKYHTLKINTGLYDDLIRLGQDQFYVFYNDTGVDIDPFKVLHLKGATSFDGELYPTFELADPRDWQKIQGTLAISCCTIANGTLGILIRSSQKISGGETLGIPAGSQLWIANDGTGSLTDVKPSFQDYALSVGGNYNEVGGNDGEIFINFTGSIDDDFHNAWDGGIRETFNFTTSSDGVNVTGLLENVINTRNLTCFFSDVGRYTLDTTTSPLTIALTPGTDGNEQKNYVYIPIETKVLTLSTSGWPLTEHCRVAELEIQSAATTQADGGTLGNQNTNDHLKTENDNGHILHIAAWIRKQFATFESGTEATFDNLGGGGYIDITGGTANQLHEQTLSAFSMIGGDFIRAWNDNGGLRPKLSNLASITAYSDGSSWNNEWGKIVVWRVVNKTGQYSPVMFNLPSGGYNSEANALSDLQQKADYSIPNNFKTKAILIAAFTFRISGGVITYSTGYEDLRGQLPIVVAGGGGGGGGGGGVTTYLALTDTPSTRIGQAGKVLTANAGESADEYTEIHKNTPLLFWQYNDSTLDEAPGAGKFLVGSGFINISNLLFNSGADVGNTLINIKNGSTIYAQNRNTTERYYSINVTGDAINNTTYYKIPISVFDENEPLVLDDIIGFNIFLNSGGGSPIRPITQTGIPITVDGGTTDLPVDNTSKKFLISDTVASQTFTTSGLSDVEEFTCKRILDNSINTVATTVFWPAQFVWDDSGVPSGLAAGGKYILELEVQSTSEVFAMLIPLL